MKKRYTRHIKLCTGVSSVVVGILFILSLFSIQSQPLHAQNAQQPFDNIWQRTLQRSFITQDTASLPDERLKPFYHGVASGDPLSDRVIIWTRITPPDNNVVSGIWRIATDTALTALVQQGEFSTNTERDFTVKIDVQGLQPNTTYYYGFTALGANSLTGRTHTLPVGDYAHARLGIVSCSNYQSGYFNAYAHLAKRNDLDAVLHLGDYIYEYATDTTDTARFAMQQGRIALPNKEVLNLSDYRTRYSTYHLDPDTRRFHQQHPFISVWDDHESANGSYKDGAENHQPEEGDWQVRKAISKRVYYEWLPIRERQDTVIHRSFSLGNLLDVFMLDTRLESREKQVMNVGSDAPQSSKDSLNNSKRTMLGTAQYEWLTQGLQNSTAQWKILGNQVMFSPVITTPVDTSQLSVTAKTLLPFLLPTLQNRFTTDLWSNYPAEQLRLMEFIRSKNVSNLLVTTGDFHCAFAYNVIESPQAYTGNNALAVEFLTPSISATNFDENILDPPLPAALSGLKALLKQTGPELLAALTSTLRKNNPHLQYFDLTHHGYVILDLTKQRAQGDWFFMDSLYTRNSNEGFATGYYTLSGESRLQQTTTPAPQKEIQQIPAPDLPPTLVPTSVGEYSPLPSSAEDVVLLALYPNPVSLSSALNYALRRTTQVRISIVDAQGREVLLLRDKTQPPGTYSLLADCSSLATGSYFYRIATPRGVVTRAFVVQR